LTILVTHSVFAAEHFHEPWSVTCNETIGFHDGDTFSCKHDAGTNGTFVVRLAGIDAPETGQAFWRSSRELLRQLAVDGTVTICYKQDRFGREVCRLKSSQGEDLAAAMLKAGMAWHAIKYAEEETSDERTLYSALTAAAKESRAGIWGNLDPQAPWECRKLRKSHHRCW
jgi:endonuclease YncB( thermonuclease family)